jgi:hypothetical protein
VSSKQPLILEWLFARREVNAWVNSLPQLFARSDASLGAAVWQAPTQDWSTEQVTGAVHVTLTAVRGFHATLSGAHVSPIAQVGRGQTHELSLWRISSRHLVTLEIEVYVAAQPPLVSVLVLEAHAAPQPDSFAERLERAITAALDGFYRRAAIGDAPSPSSLPPS